MPAYGIDTSVLVRLLTGLPDDGYRETVDRLTALRQRPATTVVAINIVVAEAYAVLQHHYDLSKADSREALISVLTSGLVEPASGDAVIAALRSPKEPGLTDRLILLDHAALGATLVTHDRKLAKLPNAQRL